MIEPGARRFRASRDVLPVSERPICDIAEPADLRRESLVTALKAVASGSHADLGVVYKSTKAKLFGICLKICADRETASDALQDTFIAVWRRADSFDPHRASPITWLAAIARNKAIDRVRSKGRYKAMSELDVESAHCNTPLSPEQRLLRNDATRWIENHVAGIKASDAAIFTAIFTEQLSYADLAERLCMPLGTVKSRVRRLLISMREEMRRQELLGDTLR